MKAIFSLWTDLVSLFYPHLCLACDRNAPPRGELICLACQLRMPQTGFHRESENPFLERFWGRLPLEAGGAQYYFTKGGRVQHLIHQLKYGGQREVGLMLGRSYGRQLPENPVFRTVDLIVPVPLHPRRERQRGFNQSACFAAGLSETMNIPWRGDILRRRAHTGTQTRKSRRQRLDNVLQAFELRAPEKIAGKHLLLVDDVMTTGATLEACGLQILSAPGTRLSLATIAIAQL